MINGNKVRRASVGSVLSGLAGQTLLFVTGILAARILGAEDRGYLSMFTAFVYIVALVGGLGLPQAIVFYLPKIRAVPTFLFNLRALLFYQIIAIIAVHTAVIFLVFVSRGREVGTAAFFTLMAAPGLLLQWYGLSILQGQERFKLFNRLRNIPLIVYATALTALYISGVAQLVSVTLVWSISNLGAGFLILFLSFDRPTPNFTKPISETLPTKREMTSFGMKGLFGWASPLDSFRLDHLIAGLLLSPIGLGFYVVGQAFTNFPKILSLSVGMIAYPVVSGSENRDDAKASIRQFVLLVSCINLLLVILLWIAIPFLVELLFGNEFMESVLLARILITGALFLSTRRIIVECFRGLGFTEISTYSELSVLPCLLISIPTLILPYGIIGLAIAVVFGQIVSLSVAVIICLRSWPQFSLPDKK